MFFCYKAGSLKAIPAFLILSTLKSGVTPLSSPEFSVPGLSKMPKQTEVIGLLLTVFSCVSDVPDPPEDLQLSEHQNRSVRLSWKAGASHNSPVNGMKDFSSITVHHLI